MPAAQKGASKKEGSAVAGQSELRNVVLTQVNVRHFKHLLLLRLHLLPAPRAAGDEAQGAAWRGPVLESTEARCSDSNRQNSKTAVPDSEGFSRLAPAPPPSVVAPPGDSQEVLGSVLLYVGVMVQLSVHRSRSFGTESIQSVQNVKRRLFEQVEIKSNKTVKMTNTVPLILEPTTTKNTKL